jgi:hypothetical protein
MSKTKVSLPSQEVLSERQREEVRRLIQDELEAWARRPVPTPPLPGDVVNKLRSSAPDASHDSAIEEVGKIGAVITHPDN